MFRLLSYLKQCKKSVLAIVLLLIVQAYCDLALPQYTSDIVDVGIQQGGITYAAPEWMREETWGSLQNLMTEGEKELTASCYEQAEDGTYERTTNKTADLEALNDTFRMPMVMLSAMDESAETALNDGADAAAPTKEQLQLLQALQNGSLSEEQLLSLRETITDQLGDMSDSLLNQKAILFVKEEYEALGKDPGSIQIAYLLKTGGKMLGFTLLMAVCAIAVSFLASRAAASIGKNLRGQVFGKVLSFSSGEMHRFSTASLITRSTNDIQQVQMVAVMLLRMISYAQLLSLRETITDQLGDMSDSLLNQKAILFVKEEYEALGKDPGSIQIAYLLKTGGKMLGFTLLMAVCAIAVSFLASRAAASIGKNLRGQVFGKVLSFSSGEMHRFSTASLITRSTNDIQQVQMVAVMLLRMISYAPILGIGGVLKVVGTKTGMAWIIGLAVAVIMAVVLILVSVAMPKFKLMQKLVDRMNLVSREILTGLSVIRAFSREKFEEKRFDEANRNLMKTQLFTNRVMTFMMPAMMLIMNCVTVMIVWFGAKGIDAGNLQVGDMMAFMTYTMQIVMSFLMITMVSVMLPRAGVAADRIEEILRTDSSIVDAKKTEDEKLTQCRGELRFEDVSFKYPGAEGDVLEHISFTAKPGQTTAVIGSTGCGKSTLIQLIPRFYDVTKGKITLDGVDIRNLSQHKLREVMGLVPQKGVLFSGTIASNIKLAGEDEISDETMKEAAQTAQATEFIDAKPEGYDSPVAQGGSNVSGGQKQRLAIARVIAKHPKVYLFDDSFSALDYKTDAALRKALHEQAADATVLIVAQRISTIMNAEQILVLEDGKIVGKGTHEELMKNCSAYQEIARSQLSESELKGGMAE